jgi:hypothetical protein
MRRADGRTTFPRLLLILILSGCTAVPLNPISNDHLMSVGQGGFEKDKESCRQEAIEEGHDTKLKPLEILMPFLLALGGAVFGLQAEYGSPLHPDEHPYYEGKVLVGLTIGGFLVGSALSIVGVLSRKRAQETSIHDCLRGRGYEFSE